mmetsp:Transcript_40375/g.64856  ORF Transcript_40375/g.64856 Transcript_40375/m.64856 type:complete len:178 (+) Transcript_40375:195-728(+)
MLAYFHRAYPYLEENQINEKLKDNLHISRLMDWFFTSSLTSHFFFEVNHKQQQRRSKQQQQQQQQQLGHHSRRYRHTKLLLELCRIWKKGKQQAEEKSVRRNNDNDICQYYYMKYMEEQLVGTNYFKEATNIIKGCFKSIIAAVFLDSNRNFITACRVYAKLTKSSHITINSSENEN